MGLLGLHGLVAIKSHLVFICIVQVHVLDTIREVWNQKLGCHGSSSDFAKWHLITRVQESGSGS